MNIELLHKYFRGETTEKEESQVVEWAERSAENKERFLQERRLFDVTLLADDTHIRRKPKGHLFLYPLVGIIAMLSIVFVMDMPQASQPPAEVQDSSKEESESICIPSDSTTIMDYHPI